MYLARLASNWLSVRGNDWIDDLKSFFCSALSQLSISKFPSYFRRIALHEGFAILGSQIWKIDAWLLRLNPLSPL